MRRSTSTTTDDDSDGGDAQRQPFGLALGFVSVCPSTDLARSTAHTRHPAALPSLVPCPPLVGDHQILEIIVRKMISMNIVILIIYWNI